MTSQNTAIQSVTNNTAWAPFLTKSYPSLDTLVVSYMGNREIMILTTEQSAFKTHPIFAVLGERLAQEDRECVEEGFPRLLVERFRCLGLSLWRVPTVSADTFRESSWIEGQNALTVVRSKREDGEQALGLCVRGESNEEVVDARKIDNLIKCSPYFSYTECACFCSGNRISTSGSFYARNQPPKWDQPISGVICYIGIIHRNDPAPSQEVPQIAPPKFQQPIEVELEPSKRS